MNDNNVESYPLVCICIPVYNGENTIRQTLQSLIDQDYPNYEILVCDNLSTDNTSDIVKEYTRKYPEKIRSIMNPVKGTAEENWNFLFVNLKTSAKYIALYHADDVYDKSIISQQLQFIKRTDVGAVFVRSRLIDEKGEDITDKTGYKVYLPDEIKEEVFDYNLLLKYTLKHHNIIRTPTLFCKQELLDKYNPFFNTDFKSSADLNSWLEIAKNERVGILNKPLHYYRMSLSQGSYLLLKGQTRLADFFKVMDNHINLSGTHLFRKELKWYNSFKAIDLIKCGRNLLIMNRKAEAKKLLREAYQLSNFPQIFSRKGWFIGYWFGRLTLCAIALHFDELVIRLTKGNKRFV
jgi:glycosyltransferase involved in cell wall biosynthesis